MSAASDVTTNEVHTTVLPAANTRALGVWVAGVALSFWWFAIVEGTFHSLFGEHVPRFLMDITPFVLFLGVILFIVGGVMVGKAIDGWTTFATRRAFGITFTVTLVTTLVLLIPHMHNSTLMRQDPIRSARMTLLLIGAGFAVTTFICVWCGSGLARGRRIERLMANDGGDDSDGTDDASVASDPHRLRRWYVRFGVTVVVALALGLGGYAWGTQHWAPKAYNYGYDVGYSHVMGPQPEPQAYIAKYAMSICTVKPFDIDWTPHSWQWTAHDWRAGCIAGFSDAVYGHSHATPK